MKLTQINRTSFLKLVYSEPELFLNRIRENEVFIVKNFYPEHEIDQFRTEAFNTGMNTSASWHPLYDSCPDYHRLHDNYEKAYVKGKIHAYYYHGWYQHNSKRLEYFREIFEMKNKLAGNTQDAVLKNIPSQGLVTRVNLHQYPRGGGYQAEHVDPHARHALIQTIVQASTPGVDYQSGGLYIRLEENSEKILLDSETAKGDLMVVNPGVRHGVTPVDPDETLDWKLNSGRWIIMPLFVWSDYPHPENIKPYQV